MNPEGKQLGWKGYADIIRMTQLRAVHAVDLVDTMNIRRETARRILTRLHELGIVYIDSWAKGVNKSMTAIPVYRYGDEPDAPGVGGKPGGWVMKPMAIHNRLPELTHFVSIITALSKPTTAKELAEEVGSNHSNILALIRHARKIKLFRVAQWERSQYGPVAMFEIGSRPDAERPKPQCQKAIASRYSKARTKRLQMLRMIHALAANSENAAEAA